VSDWFEFDESANVWVDADGKYFPPPWRIVAVPEVLTWLNDRTKLNETERPFAVRALQLLAEDGPGLGRPWVDHIKGSRIRNLKELRFTSTDSKHFRILFAFDPTRSAVLLVAGDKRGQWNRWYPRAIRLAEQRYAQYLALQRRGRS